MKLHPRHFILLALVLAAFGYRYYKGHHTAATPMTIVTTPTPYIGPRQDNPAWAAFDHAATLRDADPSQFNPAFTNLSTLIETTTPHADLDGCKLWLQFYRQSKDPAWKDRSTHHLDSCVKNHQDISS